MKKIILNSAVFIAALFSFDGGYEIPPSYRTYVNEYSSYEVESYNQKVRTHTYMIDWYNLNCAGKQSYSACKVAQELNREKGLPTQSCGN
jgi:stress protein, tellurium resistance protein terZ